LVEHWSPKPGVGRSSRSSRANINQNEENSKLSEGILQRAGTQSDLAYRERTAEQRIGGYGCIPDLCLDCFLDGYLFSEDPRGHL
jgi:hypothetical protein